MARNIGADCISPQISRDTRGGRGRGNKKIISINLDTLFRRCIVSRSHEVVGKKWRGCQVPNLDSMRLQKETGRTGEKGDRTVSDLMVSCV